MTNTYATPTLTAMDTVLVATQAVIGGLGDPEDWTEYQDKPVGSVGFLL